MTFRIPWKTKSPLLPVKVLMELEPAEKVAAKAARKAISLTTRFKNHITARKTGRFFCAQHFATLVLINGKEVILHRKAQHRQAGGIHPTRTALHSVLARP